MKSLFWTFVFLGTFLSTTVMAANDTKASLATLIAKANKYGEPKLEGTEDVAGKKQAVLYFGKKKINNNFDLVDGNKKLHGGNATFFVKDAAEFVRVSTNVLKDDGSRALGTLLARNKAYEAINKGETFCGDLDILGKMYDTCYAPIVDKEKKIIGVYYVGYIK